MKKITLFVGTFFLIFSTQAQSVLFEQTSSNASAFISGYSDVSSLGVYSADDFNLTAESEISSIRFYGIQIENDLSPYLTGFSLYIYSDASGLPSNDPSVPGSGVLEIVNLPTSSPALTIDHPGTLIFSFTVDIALAEGSPLTLTAGTYWVVPVPHYNIDASTINLSGDVRLWYWFFSNEQNLSDSQFVDPTNFFGAGFTSWAPITAYPDSTPSDKAMAFTIMGNNLSIEETTPLNGVSLYPNPVKNKLHINMPYGQSIKSAAVFDLLGKRHNMEIGDNNILDLSQIPTGIYLLKLTTPEGTLTKKFVKE